MQKLVWWMIFLSYCCSQTILTLQEAWVSRFKSRELLLIQIIYDWSIQKQTEYLQENILSFWPERELGKVKVKVKMKVTENILSFWPERELGVDDECVAGHHHAAWRILSFLHIVIVSVLFVTLFNDYGEDQYFDDQVRTSSAAMIT